MNMTSNQVTFIYLALYAKVYKNNIVVAVKFIN